MFAKLCPSDSVSPLKSCGRALLHTGSSTASSSSARVDSGRRGMRRVHARAVGVGARFLSQHKSLGAGLTELPGLVLTSRVHSGPPPTQPTNCSAALASLSCSGMGTTGWTLTPQRGVPPGIGTHAASPAAHSLSASSPGVPQAGCDRILIAASPTHSTTSSLLLRGQTAVWGRLGFLAGTGPALRACRAAATAAGGGMMRRPGHVGAGPPVRPVHASATTLDAGSYEPDGNYMAFQGPPPSVPVFVDHAFYKKSAALSMRPVRPVFRKLPTGGYARFKEGTLFLEFALSVGTRKYDWAKKQIFSLSAAEMGKLMMLQPGEKTEFFHDPNMSNPQQGKVQKALKIEPIQDKSGWYFNLSVRNDFTGTNDRISLPIQTGEFMLMKNIMNFIIPYCLGWNVFVDPNILFDSMTRDGGYNQPAPYSDGRGK